MVIQLIFSNGEFLQWILLSIYHLVKLQVIISVQHLMLQCQTSENHIECG